MMKTIKRQVVSFVEETVEVGPGYLPIYYNRSEERWADSRSMNDEKLSWLPLDPLTSSPSPGGTYYGFSTWTEWLYVPEDVSVQEALAALNGLKKL